MQIDRDIGNSSQSSDGEDVIGEILPDKSANSICMRLNFDDKRKAEIVYNAVIVDKEHKRSQSQRQITLDGNFIVANITSNDPKSLMKTANNIFDMCQLSRSCIETVGSYKFVKNVPEKKDNKKKKNKLK